MGALRILLWFGYALLASAAFMGIAGLIGLIMFEIEQGLTMLALCVMTGLVGALMITASYRTSGQESASEAILFLMLFWTALPLVCAFPFLALGATSEFGKALFESVSAITTTGASTLNTEDLSDTMLFWRSLLQFFGGVSAATFAVVILAALNLTGTGIHRSGLFTFRTGELFPKVVRIGRLVCAIYLFLALIAFVLMVMGGTDAFTALCLALSGISTGGLQPFVGPVSNVLNPFSAVILALLCLFGAFNVSILWDFLRIRRFRQFLKLMFHVEHRGLLAIAGALILLTVIFADLTSFGSAMIDSLFFVSSAGYRYDVISLDMIPAPILIAVALIGGSALSTAGGIKVIRLLLLFRHLGTDVARLSHPSRVKPIEFRSSVIEDREFLSIWMYFFGYSLCFALGALSLAAAGLNLQDSLATSAASLSNMGPLLDLTLPSSGLRYSDFTGLQMGVSGLLMLIGRVEVLVALSLLVPATWRQ